VNSTETIFSFEPHATPTPTHVHVALSTPVTSHQPNTPPASRHNARSGPASIRQAPILLAPARLPPLRRRWDSCRPRYRSCWGFKPRSNTSRMEGEHRKSHGACTAHCSEYMRVLTPAHRPRLPPPAASTSPPSWRRSNQAPAHRLPRRAPRPRQPRQYLMPPSLVEQA
jgi:hypothetical protein